jgi:hypothetical protein
MEYYKITPNENLPNIIYPMLPSFTELWSEEAPIFIRGKAKSPLKRLTFLPFYKSHCFLVNGKIAEIWQNYQIGGRYRQCAMGSIEQKKIDYYSVMMPKMVDGIHPSTEYHKNGDIKNMVLSRTKVGPHKVFGIKDRHLTHLIITEDILEEILQENIVEFIWKHIGSQ